MTMASTLSAVETATSWDADAVIAHAKEMIHSSNYEKVGEARDSIDRTLAEWTQQVAKLRGEDPASASRGESAILQLWRLYATLEIDLRQFKQATKVFESATSCPIAGSSAALWLQYSTFCLDRKKFSNARKVFVRAMRAVPNGEQEELWTHFLAFVKEHVDPNMTPEMLKAQVFSDSGTAPAKTNVPAAPASSPSTPSATPIASTSKPTAADAVEKPEEPAATVVVDPSLAFIDRKGEHTPEAATEKISGGKRSVEQSAGSELKRTKLDEPVAEPSPPTPTDVAAPVTEFFHAVPMTLPNTPACPHLLFDELENEEEVKDNGLLERLSEVLADSAVFQGVRDLLDNQRQRDRDTLARWQDLVGMQMKEGSELFARHMDLEKDISDPRDLIALKTQHHEQRAEFVHRCKMSQQQFIDICEMDRSNALRAQQISLQNMKIPEMSVTTDATLVNKQRTIVSLILQAEKLWRLEQEKTKQSTSKTAPAKTKGSRRGGRGSQNLHDYGASQFRGNGLPHDGASPYAHPTHAEERPASYGAAAPFNAGGQSFDYGPPAAQGDVGSYYPQQQAATQQQHMPYGQGPAFHQQQQPRQHPSHQQQQQQYGGASSQFPPFQPPPQHPGHAAHQPHYVQNSPPRVGGYDRPGLPGQHNFD
ncbi:hypothetical protein P43SY_003166 [Pythium insidiosum]|uniref:Pre-mRNA-splicing factor Syf1-like N-terminal HAT-repeats domain-containing protein n=1 Tax=Pythium insidiosum TaxID=114742 RepID=A0AAD5M8C6_PYTIN|nr:hypothetical protein P43SY_003166 [Pythium insidiosum]